MKDFVLRDEFRNHLRPLSKKERQLLQCSLLEDGCREPLVIWKNGSERILIDGYNRYDICTENRIEYALLEMDFCDEQAVYRWMENNQRARRNQTATAERYYLGCRYLREVNARGGDRKSSDHCDHVINKRICEHIAEQEGCGPATVRRAAKFTRLVNELDAHIGGDLKWLILQERLKLNKKLSDALLESKVREARKAIAEATPKDEEKPLKASAILEYLDAGAASIEPERFDSAYATVKQKVMKFADKLSRQDLTSFVTGLKSLTQYYERKLKQGETA